MSTWLEQNKNRFEDPLEVSDRFGRPADSLRGLWAPSPAFLVCGGPSLRDVRLDRLRERGVVSLGVNLSAAWVPVKAWVFSDPQTKFHHGLYLDPGVMTFCPQPKMERGFMVKMKDGSWRRTTEKIKRITVGITVRDCPNTFGYHRRTCFVPNEFFTTPYAHWGPGKHQPPDVPAIGCFCTMLIGIRLLHWLGVRKIYMIGVDHQGRDGKCYGFPNEKGERVARYDLERQMLEALVEPMKRHGVELINCSATSRCNLYCYVPFDDAVDDCKGDVPNEPFDCYGWYLKNEVQLEAEKYSRYIPKFFE